MKKNRQNSVKSLLEDINNISKIIKETYAYSDEDEDGVGEIGYQEEEDVPMDDDVESEMGVSNDDMSIVAKIRDAALEGIAAYKDDVNNLFYEFYKKTFLSCDKVMEESKGGQPQEGGNLE